MNAAPRPTLLVADPDPKARQAACAALREDYDVLEAGDRDAAWRILEDQYVQAVFCGLSEDSPEARGFLRRLRRRWPEVIRVVLTDPGEHEELCAVLPEIGPHQVLSRPCPPDLLKMAARNATASFTLAREHDRLRLELRCLGTGGARALQAQRAAHEDLPRFDRILRAPNSPLSAVVARALHFASFDVPVLIQGAHGTGKALLARAMHDSSLRSDQPFLTLECSGLPAPLIELELFGAKRGPLAPGGAQKLGLVAQADHGTLYLDGIDLICDATQLALLRLLRDQSYAPLGATERQSSRLRLIASCHETGQAAVAAGRLRADLYYALSVAELALPPLRARRGDIPALASQILAEVAARHGKPVRGLTQAALDFLQAYDWPGNIPELRNELTRMLIFAQAPELDADLVSPRILQALPQGADSQADAALAEAGTLKDRVERMEMRLIRETLTRLKWNKSRAADELGLSRVGLRAKLDRYGMAPPKGTPEPQEAEEA